MTRSADPFDAALAEAELDPNLPPHDSHAEEAVLGAVLRMPSVVAKLTDLAPQDFYTERYRVIWTAMLDLWQRNIAIDYTTLGNRLLDTAAAQTAVAELAVINLSVPSPWNVEHYARIIQGAATQRRYIQAAQTIAEKAWRHGADVEQLAREAAGLLQAAAPRRSSRDLYDPERWAETLMNDQESRAIGQRTSVGTGLADLDAMTLGLEAGGLYLVMGTPGTGKALAIDTPIPTPTGWIPMGSIRVGDEVFDDQGRPTRVNATSGIQQDKECFEVEFSDGSIIVASGDHRWLTQTDPERKYLPRRVVNPRTHRSEWSRLPTSNVRTTKELASTLKRSDGGLNHSVAVAAPLQLPETDLPIDPYTLGAWLGDGSSTRASILASDRDREVLAHVADAGHEVREHRYGDQPNFAEYSVVGGLHVQLRDLGLYNNKHIPIAYQRASITQRLALLQGLMDTDGSCSERQGDCEFGTTSDQLGRDVYDLVCSLGIKATVGMAAVAGRRPESSVVYRIRFTTTTPVFRLERKRGNQPTVARATQKRRYIVAVRPIASVPVQCIAVEAESHLFLAGRSFIPTHNTELAMQIGVHVGRTHGAVVFASLEMTAVELGHRYARITRGMDRNRLAKGQLDEAERVVLLDVVNLMQQSRFWPSSPTGQYTTTDLRADALEVQAKAGKVALIVADYVQRFRDRGSSSSSREENIGLVAENLKSLAREFGCPVLAPVQPNREYVSRPNKRPVLSDLRESGKLEQEADVVLGLYRDEKHDQETRDRGLCEIHMLKNRSGVGDADGMRKLVWKGTRYENFTPEQRSPLPWAAD